MTAAQREKILDHVANYAREEIALAFAETKKQIEYRRDCANNEWKAIEDLLKVDAWEISLPTIAESKLS